MKTNAKHSYAGNSRKRSSILAGLLFGIIFLNGAVLNAQTQQQLRVRMVQEANADEALIVFRQDACIGFDRQADIEETFAGGFNLFTMSSEGQSLATNAMRTFDCSEVVPLIITNASEGAYSLEFSEYETFPYGVSLTLYDYYANTSVDITAASVYNFDITSAPESYNAGRFEVSFQAVAPAEDFEVTGSVQCKGLDGQIEITNTVAGLTYSYSNDTTVLGTAVSTGDTIRFTILASNLVNGDNTYKIKSANSSCQTDYHKNVSVRQLKVFPVKEAIGAQRCDEGSLVLQAFMTPDEGVYNWYDSETAVTPIITQSKSTFETPVLSETTTYYVSMTTKAGCEGPRESVVAEITMPYPAAIDIVGDTLKSNYATGNQWYLNGEIINGATAQNYIGTETGIYSVSVNNNSCSSSADIEFVKSSGTSSITAYPNPVITQTMIEVAGDTANPPTTARLLNNVGLLIKTVSLYVDGGKIVGQVDMQDCPGGVYIIEVNNDGNIMQLKIIKS